MYLIFCLFKDINQQYITNMGTKNVVWNILRLKTALFLRNFFCLKRRKFHSPHSQIFSTTKSIELKKHIFALRKTDCEYRCFLYNSKEQLLLKPTMTKKNKNIVVYQAKNGAIELREDVRAETVWASLDQIANLFGRDKSVISRHIKNTFVGSIL